VEAAAPSSRSEKKEEAGKLYHAPPMNITLIIPNNLKTHHKLC